MMGEIDVRKLEKLMRWERGLVAALAYTLLADPAAHGAAPAAAQTAAPGPAPARNIAGTWTLMNYKHSYEPARSRIPQTIEGTAPPLQPWAEALYQQRIAASESGSPFLPPSAECLPLGVPMMMMAANMPIQVMVSPRQVTLLFEEQHTFRAIRINQPHLPDPDPGWFGDSVGHWEGDTLVIDTIGFTDRTTLDFTGMPHSEDMHVIEHMRRVDARTLEDLITIEDPKTFLRPWTTRMRYEAFDGPMHEYVCENNRGFEPPK
jgi:hypothetical protein